MTEPVIIGNAEIYQGDCLAVLKTLPDNSVDSVVTDPPYGLRFMNRHWDYDVPTQAVWQEVLRVLKPGGHLLSFSSARTYHRMVVAIEDAGFEVRDQIMWVYGSGFPKSLDVSKALDRMAGAEREVTHTAKRSNAPGTVTNKVNWVRDVEYPITAPATEPAKQWAGWGTALKPAHEPICLARKPLIGTVAENVMAHGTGALNIDASRIPTEESLAGGSSFGERKTPMTGDSRTGAALGMFAEGAKRAQPWEQPQGRWPANLIHDGSDQVVGLFPDSKGQQGDVRGTEPSGVTDEIYGKFAGRVPAAKRGDSGSAARFFYCAKASKRDRDEGLEGFERQATAFGNQAQAELKRGNLEHADGTIGMNKVQLRRNHHPTVKPTPLMQWLVRLITPPGGIVLDPFCGSGSTGKAAVLEGFDFIGIEREAEYLEIAKARIAAVEPQQMAMGF